MEILMNYCQECDTGFSDNCYRNKSCIFYKKMKIMFNECPHLMRIYKKIYNEAPPKQKVGMCQSCKDNKPEYCRYRVPRCIDSKIGNNVCKNCANGKKRCLGLKHKCEFPTKYINHCNICYFTAKLIKTYWKLYLLSKIKSKKLFSVNI